MDDEERIVMQCKYCGQTIPDNANYCSGCGRAVREEATEVKRYNVPIVMDSLVGSIESDMGIKAT